MGEFVEMYVVVEKDYVGDFVIFDELDDFFLFMVEIIEGFVVVVEIGDDLVVGDDEFECVVI